MSDKHVGLADYRLNPQQENLREIAFAEQWQLENDQGRVLRHLLNPLYFKGTLPDVTDRDIQVAATVIQWLGSNVGMSFLEEVIKKSPEVKQRLKNGAFLK